MQRIFAIFFLSEIHLRGRTTVSEVLLKIRSVMSTSWITYLGAGENTKKKAARTIRHWELLRLSRRSEVRSYHSHTEHAEQQQSQQLCVQSYSTCRSRRVWHNTRISATVSTCSYQQSRIIGVSFVRVCLRLVDGGWSCCWTALAEHVEPKRETAAVQQVSSVYVAASV